MGLLTPKGFAPEIGRRQDQYQRREHLTTWTGAGLLGLIAFSAGDVAKDILDDAPTLLTAILVTCLTLGGAALALARVGYEWAGTSIRRHVDTSATETDDAAADAVAKAALLKG